MLTEIIPAILGISAIPGIFVVIGVLLKENNHFKAARGFYTASLIYLVISILGFSFSCIASGNGGAFILWLVSTPVLVFIATRITKGRSKIDALIAEKAVYKTKRNTKKVPKKK